MAGKGAKTNMKIHHLSCLHLAFLLFMLPGCGRSRQATRSASVEISEAEQRMDSAAIWVSKNEIMRGIDEYKKAQELVLKGRVFAEGSELSKLKNLDEEVRQKLNDLEIRKFTQRKAPENPTAPIVASAPDSQDVRKKKAADEDEKKKKNAATALQEALAIQEKPKTKEEDMAPETPRQTSAGTGEVGQGDDPKDDEQKISKPIGPFPAVTEKSPAIAIVKIITRGKYAAAYIQIYNSKEQEKRIGRVSVYFKDKDNQTLIKGSASTAIYPFQGFNVEAQDMLFGQAVEALTIGSQNITGFNAIQLVAVGVHDKAADVRKVSVEVLFTDETKIVADGGS